MFIRELYVDGYGALQGTLLTLDRSVTILYGPNEAGKSTLLRFIRAMLYGFPSRKELVERGEPVRGGRHGGRLLLAEPDGREWLLERYAERGSGLTVRDPSGMDRQLSQAEWERLALGGITEKLFRQLFAVSLDELHQLRTLQGEEVGNYLYHAGLAGGAALTAARRRLGAEMDRLYRPKGVTQEMNKLLAAIKDAEAAIRQSRDQVQLFNELSEELRATELGIAETEQQLPLLRTRVLESQSAYELREWWLKAQSLRLEEEEARSSLPNPAAPLLQESAQSRWTELKARRSELAEKLEQANQAMAELTRTRDSYTWSNALLESLPEWERLESLREGIAARREEAAELEAERRMLEEQLSSYLMRLSPGWGEGELRAFGSALSEQEQLRRLAREREEAQRALEPIAGELKRIERMSEALHAEMAEAPHEEEAPDGFETLRFLPRDRTSLLQAWHGLEDAMRAFERVVPPRAVMPAQSDDHAAGYGRGKRARRAGSSRTDRFPVAMIGGSAALLAVAAIIMPFALRGDGGSVDPIMAAISAVFLLLAGGLAYIAYRTSGRSTGPADVGFPRLDESTLANIRAHRNQVSERLRQLIADPETAAASLMPEAGKSVDHREANLQAVQADEAWRQLREAVHARLGELERRDRDAANREQRARRGNELRTEQQLLERERTRLNERIEELNARWQHWLQSYALTAGLNTDSLSDLFNQADQALTALRHRQRVAERQQTVRHAIEGFEQSAARLIAQSQASLPPAISSDAVLAVRYLYTEAARQQEARREAHRTERQLETAAALVGKLREQAELAEADIEAFLAESHSTDEAELELRLRVDERCRTLRREARDIQLRIESGRSEAAREKLYAWLREHDEAALAAILSEQNAALAAEERRRTELFDRRGRLMQELERLRTDAELEDRRQTLIERESQLESLLARYAVLALSERLMSRAKAAFEEERQPEVLKRASRLFNLMTGGAYERIVAPGDRSGLLAESANRQLLDSAFLSRGTQEQLYLAMRFALCEATSRERPLPLLLDDLFVHFDEKRLASTLPVLEEISGSRQLILFTCHRHVADLLEHGIKDAKRLALP
ncbi:AAA family ATPase [Cohnella panacarvi]|uniref:AAA family ATPase n=1 Tax=Cohnella panacarvi TaxID=400776 RepID=UPI00047C483A|nr:AAA family ATPase [Cohnella panacarvi]